jgi:hypothetical protein
MELVVKVAGYDRNFAQHAGERAKLLLVVKPGDGESARVGALFACLYGACKPSCFPNE